MSFFNTLAGGPRNGYRFILDSGFAWSQHVFYLKKCLVDHIGNEVPFVTVRTDVPLEQFGIASRGPSPKLIECAIAKDECLAGPVPGWHAIDIQAICDPDMGYGYFSLFHPVATAAYSIRIYHISLDDANRVRRSLRLNIFNRQTLSTEQFVNRLEEESRRPRVLVVAFYQEAVDSARESREPDALLKWIRSQPHMVCNLVDSAAIVDGQLDKCDVVVFPGGSASAQATSLGISGRKKVREYVDSGGGYLGVCRWRRSWALQR